jgi:hypothetical protein
VILYIFSGRLNNCSRLHSPFVIIIARGGLTAFFFPYGNMPLCLQAIFCCEGGLLGLLFDTPLGKGLLRTLKYFLKQVLRSLLHPISVALLGGGPLPTSSVVLLCASRLYISAQSSFIYLAVIPAFVSATQDGAGSPPPLVEVNQAILAWSL